MLLLAIIVAMSQQSAPAAPVNTAPDQTIEPGNGDQSGDIVVVGRRGEAAIAVEKEFSERDIAADGSDTIGELLSHLRPFIDPKGGNSVILINGRPAGFDTSILSYPIGALSRVAVLKPEAGPRYGAKAGIRVVNLVLKPKYASVETEAGINAATEGGQFGGSLGVTRTAIDGDTRWNAHIGFDRQSALKKSSRPIPQSDAWSGSDGGIPRSGDRIEAPTDVGDLATLLPSTRNLAVGASVARPIGSFAASLALDATRGDSIGFREIGSAPLIAIADSGWSPSGSPLIQQLVRARSLRSATSVRTLAVSSTLTGRVWGVHVNFAASFSASESRDLLETGIDAQRMLQWLTTDGRRVGPNGTLDDSFINVTHNHSRANNINIRFGLQKSLLKLPAGPMSLIVSANVNRAQSSTSQSDNSMALQSRFSQAQASGQISLNLPISSQGSSGGMLRDLAFDLSIGFQTMKGMGLATSYSGGVAWSPFAWGNLRASIDRTQDVPSIDQLNGSVVTTFNSIFDYHRLEFVEPAWTTGGNPLLKRGYQTGFSYSLTLRPIVQRDLTLNVGYRQSVASNAPISFPSLTPAIEEAFPERIHRDSSGRLIAVDARPFNVERQLDATLSSSVALRLGGTRRLSSNPVPLNLAADRFQINLSLGHQLILRSESLIRSGLPVVDRLTASGASRHAFDIRISVSKRAFGASVSVNGSSAARVASGDKLLRLTPPLTFNLSSFINLDRMANSPRDRIWLKGLKLSLDVQNLLAAYSRVRLPDNSAPPGYSRFELDPLGRTGRLTLRKKF